MDARSCSESEERALDGPPAKNARQYVEAVDVICEIADVAIDFIPGGGAAKKVVKYAPKVMKAAKMAAPVLDQHSDSINAAVGKVREGAPDAVKAAAGLAKKGGGAIAGTVGKAFSVVSSPIKESLDASRDKKAQTEAHRKVIEHAIASMPVGRFRENEKEHEALSGGSGPGYMGYAGCYIFLVLGKGSKKDLAGYRAAYVGASSDMGASVADEIAGKGNVDVYADIKYDQGVHVLFYPCAESELERMRQSLVIALDADESYNQAE